MTIRWPLTCYMKREKVNHPFGERGATWIYLASKAKNIDLLMRLTSDQANVLRIAGSQKASALKLAMQLGRKDIQALFILASTLGPNWMQMMPDSVERLRRLSGYYNENQSYPLLDKESSGLKNRLEDARTDASGACS